MATLTNATELREVVVDPAPPAIQQITSSQSYSKLVPVDRPLNKSEIAPFMAAMFKQHENEKAAGTAIEDLKPHPVFFDRDVTLTFKDVSFAITTTDPVTNAKVQKTILEPVSGHFEPGQLVAIMGPSGCGKSTLLDILAGRKTTAHGGQVYLNGNPRDELFSKVTAYVPQADQMHAHQTVREAVTFQMLLSRNLPAGENGKEVRKQLGRIVELQLADLGLDQVADTKVGDHSVRGISGGQKRRVTLAKGIVSGARVLFCDEPTSGLSSTDAEVAVTKLKAMTKKFGISIFVVIHQPKQEVAALFDHLLLLTSEPGRAVYNGPMQAAFEHYSKVGFPVPAYVNPADFYLDLVSPSYKDHEIDAFVNFYRANCAPAIAAQVDAQLAAPGKTSLTILQDLDSKLEKLMGKPAMPAGAPFAAPFVRQLRMVFGRAVSLRGRDKLALKADVGSTLVKGVIVGIAFFDTGSNPAFNQMPFIFMAMQMSVMGGMQQMPSLIASRDIMKLDVKDRLYSEWAFILTELILNNAVSQTLNIVFLLIAFGMSGVGFDKFGAFYLWQLLVILTTDSLFSTLAAVAKTAEQAQAMAIPPLMFCVIFNGFFVTLRGVQPWMKWAIYCSPVFYGIQQISIELFSDGVPTTDPAYPASGQFVIDNYDFRDDWSGIAVGVLFALIVFFRFLQVVALKRLNNPER